MISLKTILSQKYILASKSPRRKQLLKQIGLNATAVDSGATELELKDHNPIHLVRHNSVLKSESVAANYKKEIVIGADTIVLLGKEILNKPRDLRQAKEYLKALSGNLHYVYTGINVINSKSGKVKFAYEKTSVYFRTLQKDEIDYYVKKFKPLDKAGAYGIQDDFGCLFIEKIKGDYYNIMGLPLVKLYETIQKVL